jgi:hypothetical protein
MLGEILSWESKRAESNFSLAVDVVTSVMRKSNGATEEAGVFYLMQ